MNWNLRPIMKTLTKKLSLKPNRPKDSEILSNISFSDLKTNKKPKEVPSKKSNKIDK